jgi:phosphonoacetaldehyde hydrolase
MASFRIASRPRFFTGPLKAAILDWSGTTCDAHVLAPAVVFVEVFKKHGVPISMKEARVPMGLRKDLHIAEILKLPSVADRWRKAKGTSPDPSSVSMLFADFVPMQMAVLDKYSTLLPRTAETVQILRDEYKLKIGCTTGFTRVMVDKLLANTKAQGYSPDTTVAGDDVPNDMGFRPAPFMLYQNLCNLGVFPIKAVVKVDDTVSGVGEGLNAGSWTVGIAGHSNYTDVDSLEQWEAMSAKDKEDRVQISRDRLKSSGAHYVIDDIWQLVDVVKDINARLVKHEQP